MRLFAILTFAVAMTTWAIGAEPPAPDQALAMCRSDLGVTEQFALHIRNDRNRTEQELARVRAENVRLKAQIAELSKSAEKPEAKEPEGASK